MLRERLWPFLEGYVIIKVKGGSPERFINLACERGISLWQVRRVRDGFVTARVLARDLRSVARIARPSRCSVSVDRKVGLVFVAGRVLRRKFLVLGAAVFCAALYVLSSLVWFVEVRGGGGIDRARVLETCARFGARPWAFVRGVDARGLAGALLASHPELAWAGVSIKGTRVVIELVPKTLAPAKARREVIRARTAGVVCKLIVLSGQAAVKEGDTVSAGQVLIRSDGAREARGIVEARVWYEASARVHLTTTVPRLSGRTRRIIEIRAARGDRTIRIPAGLGSGRPFPEEEVTARRSLLRGARLHRVEITVITISEVIREKVVLSREEAVERARWLARQRLAAESPGGTAAALGPSPGLTERVLDLSDSDGPLVEVRAALEAVADIADYSGRDVGIGAGN